MPTDPIRARRFPEVFPAAEISGIVNPGVTANLAAFTRLKEKNLRVDLKSIAGLRQKDTFLALVGDTRRFELNSGALPNLDQKIDTEIPAETALFVQVINRTTAPIINYRSWFTYEITRQGRELRLNHQDALYSGWIAVGLQNLPPGFYDIGPVLHVSRGEVWVIDKIATERTATTDVLLHISRDEDDRLITLQCHAMPGLETGVKCWIPAVDRIAVQAEVLVDQDLFRARYRYLVFEPKPEELEVWL